VICGRISQPFRLWPLNMLGVSEGEVAQMSEKKFRVLLAESAPGDAA
jgi:hypothetical protein